MFWDRRLRSGYSDLGPIEIAPTAQAIIMTDRDDGSLWLLSFSTDPKVRLSLNSDFGTIQRREGIRFYEADDGPIFSENGQYRMFVRGGRIGVEFMDFDVGIQARNDPPLNARTKFAQKEVNLDNLDVASLHIEVLDG